MKILDMVSQKITEKLLLEKEVVNLDNIPNQLNFLGYDNWGMNREAVAVALKFIKYLYQYFRVETEGIENIPSGRVLLVANHSGQLPIDGALIYYAMATQA